jgi:hypothetical protein
LLKTTSLLELQHEIYTTYGNFGILESVDAEDFREFILMFYSKARDKTLRELYTAAYSQMVAGIIDFISFDDFAGKKKHITSKEDVESNMKMIERIMNSTVKEVR